MKLPAGRLTQVVLNLVLNAGDAIEADGAEKRTREAAITVRARRDGQAVRIEIEDDGPGIPAEFRERLFEPFVTSKEVGKGTGLGLAVCRGIVESAKGEITLDPGFENGARFVVTLPAA